MTTAQRPTLEAVARGPASPGRRCPGWSTAPPRWRRPSGRGHAGGRTSWGTCPTRPPAAWSPSGPTRSPWSLPEAATRVFSDDQFFPGHHPGRQPGAGGGRQAAGADAGRLAGRATTGSSGTPPAGTSTGCMLRLDARRRPAARPRWPGWAYRWCAAAGRWRRPTVPYVDVDHVGGVGRGGAPPGRQRPPPDRHHRRPAGHGRRHRPARRLPGRRCATPTAARSSRSATSPASRATAAMRQLLADDPDLDAVFVASDLMAHGALRTLRQAGRRVPDDVAVVGFDDIETAALHRAAADHRAPADRRAGPEDGPTAAGAWPTARRSSGRWCCRPSW